MSARRASHSPAAHQLLRRISHHLVALPFSPDKEIDARASRDAPFRTRCWLSLRAVLSFCNARQMTSPEAYIQYSADVFQANGEVTDDSTEAFLRAYMSEFRTYIGMVLSVLAPARAVTRPGCRQSGPYSDR